MNKKVIINDGLLFDADEVKNYGTVGDGHVYKIEYYSITQLDLKEINKAIKGKVFDYEECLLDKEKMIQILKDYVSISDIEETADIFEVDEDSLYYDSEVDELFYYDLDYAQEAIKYWDGSNWQHLWIENKGEITISEDYVSLDEWDGNHMCTGTHSHARVYKILKSEDNGKYLLVQFSDYQGANTTCEELLDEDELEIALKNLDRNPVEYFELLNA